MDFCVQCWRDTLARRKREVKVRAPSGFVFGGGGMTPIEPRAQETFTFFEEALGQRSCESQGGER